jgi:hypothetical protein
MEQHVSPMELSVVLKKNGFADQPEYRISEGISLSNFTQTYVDALRLRRGAPIREGGAKEADL